MQHVHEAVAKRGLLHENVFTTIIILLVVPQNYPEDSVREEMRRLLEEKGQYETTAKESLGRVLQEKLDAATKLADLERYGFYNLC